MHREGVRGSGSHIARAKNQAHLNRKAFLARSSLAVIEQLDPRRLLTVITVTSTADTIANDGVVTLREAITAANTNAPSGDAPAGELGDADIDTIIFDIPGDGVQTISPTSPLPAITDNLSINGFNNTDDNFDFDLLPVQISGNLAGSDVDGFNVQSDEVSIDNLAINRFSGNGVAFHSSHNDELDGDFIGTDSTGTFAMGNGGDGILLDGASSVTIGQSNFDGLSPNVISGNGGHGIELINGSDNNVIQANHIGTSLDDTLAIPNTKDGIHIADSGSDTIGGQASNEISANGGYGIFITGASSTNNDIDGNTIGDSDSSSGLGNTLEGVHIESSHNFISNSFDGNEINGNGGFGIHIASGQFNVIDGDRVTSNGSGGVFVESPNNTIGTDFGEENTIIDNNGPGIDLGAGAHDTSIVDNEIGIDSESAAPNLIGVLIDGAAKTTLSRNTISGNTGDGVLIQGDGATGNHIIANEIGLSDESEGIPNTGAGIEIRSSGSSIGSGSNVGANTIAGNAGAGILISGNNNSIFDNFIGLDTSNEFDEINPVGNLIGVELTGTASGNVIGGGTTTQGNHIQFNGVGVSVEGSAVNNAILSNLISDNVLLGIDLKNDGPTPNDTGDADTGPNNLQNTPVISSATSGGLNTTVSGTLNSSSNSSFLIQFFSNTTADASGFGEGAALLGQATVMTNVSGDATFNADFPTVLVTGQFVSATATLMDGTTPMSTSEFSNAASVTGNLPTIDVQNVESSEGDSGITQFIFNATLSSVVNKTVTFDYSTTDGTASSPADYFAQTGTITFAPGQTTAAITINVNGDTTIEDDETFAINLSNAVNGQLDENQVTGTIDNDDFPPPPVVTINNVSMNEGNSDQTEFVFTLTRTGDLSGFSQVDCDTEDGTANAFDDFSPHFGFVDFDPGQKTATFSVFVNGDTVVEPNETFTVQLDSDENAIVQGFGTGTIKNDDGIVPPPPSSGTVSVISDPTASGKKALRVEGTSKDDKISITQSGSAQGKAVVKINNVTKGTFSFSGAILVYGDAGNDTITIDSKITRNTFIYGGDGKDTVSGGGGSNVICGEGSNDSLKGNAGRDILVGGDGTDKLDGAGGDDILIGGSFKTNPSLSQLASLLKEWTRTDANYATRVNHLKTGGGFNSIKLTASTLFSSANVKDSLTGGSGSDFFFGAVPGAQTDKTGAETLIDIG